MDLNLEALKLLFGQAKINLCQDSLAEGQTPLGRRQQPQIFTLLELHPALKREALWKDNEI